MSLLTLKMEGTAKSPEIVFSPDGHLKLSGRAIPENAPEFFRPLLDWIDDYADAPDAQTHFDVRLLYINTSATKCLLDVFKRLDRVEQAGSAVSIRWYYQHEDEDMEEMGKDFKQILQVPLEMIAVDSL